MGSEEIKAEFCCPGAYNCTFESGWVLQFNPTSAEELVELCGDYKDEDGEVTDIEVCYTVAKCGTHYIILQCGGSYISAANPNWDNRAMDITDAMILYEEDRDSISKNGMVIYGEYESCQEAEEAIPLEIRK